MTQKPPLGLTPEWRHKELRLQEIRDAIQRYLDADQPIPVNWIAEEYALRNWLENRKVVFEPEPQSTSTSREWEIVKHGYCQNNEGKPEQQYIHSVKRLSDNEVFSVGETVATNDGRGQHRINGFKIVDGDMCADMNTFLTKYEFLSKIQKPATNPPLSIL